MDKLTEFYIELSKDAEKMNAFVRGASEQEVARNRVKMLTDAGIGEVEEIVGLDQKALHQVIAKRLGEQSVEWRNLATLNKASDDNDNRVSGLGRGRV